MPAHDSSRQKTQAARSLTLPASGMEHVRLSQGQNVEFTFAPDSVVFSRSGSDLLITGGNGAALILDGFFTAESADALPQLIFPGGENVSGADFLQNLHIDIVTTAGPEASATPPSGGEGEYSDGTGNLLDGVDRLGSLGTDRWEGARKAVEVHVDTDRRVAVAPDNGPDGPPAPKDPPIFNARAVLYMQNEGDAPDGEPYTDRGVTAQALARNSDGRWEASGEPAASIQAHAGNDLDVNKLIEYVMDEHGNITFRLTAAGKAWMAAQGKDMEAYYTITDANGNSYVLQVVISADGSFHSSSEHNGNLDPSGLVHGEWHDGKDMSKETDYKTTSSNLSDDLRYTGKLSGAEIRTGYAEDKNWGNDSVTVNGDVDHSSITSGSGNDLISISGNVTGSAVDTGAGAGDRVNIRGTVFSENASDNNTIKAVDGTADIAMVSSRGESRAVTAEGAGAANNVEARQVILHAESADGMALGLYARTGGRNTVAGREDVTVTAKGGWQAYGVSAELGASNGVAGGTVGISATAQGLATGVRTWGDNASNSVAADGAMRITVEGGNAGGVSASGAGAHNTLKAGGDLTITGTGKADSHGAVAQAGGKNALSGQNIAITATAGDDAKGIFAQGAGSVNTVTADNRVGITAAGDKATGMHAENRGRNEVSAKSVNITASGTGPYSGNTGVFGLNGGSNSITADGDVDILATGGYLSAGMSYVGSAQTDGVNRIGAKGDVRITATGASWRNSAMQAENFGGNEIRDAGSVTLRAESKGAKGCIAVCADGREAAGAVGAFNSIHDVKGAVTLIAKGAAGSTQYYEGNIGMLARNGGQNSLYNAASVDIQVENPINGGVGYGMKACGSVGKGPQAKNHIHDIAGNVTVAVEGGKSAYGMYASESGSNLIEKAAAVKISTTSKGTSEAITADGPVAMNTVEAGRVSLTAESESGTAMGMHAGRCATNQVYAIENVDISARGGSSAHGMFAESGAANHVAAATVTVSAVGTKEADGIAALGNGARNSVATFGAVNISAQGENACGVRASSGGAENSVRAGRDLSITATGTAFAQGVSAQGKGASNTVSAVDPLWITATGDTAHGVSARDGALNTVSAKTLNITAEGTRAAYGAAAGNGGKNSITAKESVVITATGDTAYGVSAQGAGSSNTVKSDARLSVTALGTTLAQGVFAQGNGASSSVSSLNRLDITAKTTGPGTGQDAAAQGKEGAFGLYAANGGKAGAEAKDLHITATTLGDQCAAGGRADNGGHVELTGINIEVRAKVEAVDKAGWSAVRAAALETHNGDITVNMTGNARNTLLLEAGSKLSGYSDFAAGIFAEGKSNVLIQSDKNNIKKVTIKTTSDAGPSAGIYTSGKDADVVIRGGDKYDEVSINATSGAGRALGIHVSNDSSDVLIDTGTGDDLVTIRANSAASDAYGLENAGGTITVKAVDGTAKIDASTNKGGSYAMMASGAGAKNDMEARYVFLEAESDAGVAMGMYAKGGAGNTVFGKDRVDIKAKGTLAHGLWADGGSRNSVESWGAVTISATGTMGANGIVATGNNAGNTLSAGGSVNITATGSGATVNGVSASGKGAGNTISAGGSVGITAEGTEPGKGRALGVTADKGANTITAGGAVGITAENGAVAYGVSSTDGGTNTLKAGGVVNITAEAQQARGLSAMSGGRNEVTAGNVNINVTGSSYAIGMYGESKGSNTITATGNVNITAKGAGSNTGMMYEDSADGKGRNLIDGKGDVRVTASGGRASNVGMRATGFGGNEISGAKSVTVNAESAGALSCIAMYANGDKATGAVGAYNSIHDVAGAVTLIAKGAVGEIKPDAYHGNSGMLAYNGGRNEIFKAGSVDIQVESPAGGVGGWGMKACGSGAQGPQEMNYIHDITGRVSVDVGGGKAAYGMYAADGGANRIENTGGVDISAHGAAKNYAMYAADGGMNTIANPNGNALIVVIKAQGGSLADYAMFAGDKGTNQILGGKGNDVISLKGDIGSEGSGKNIIDTGAGDDRITLDGKVSGDFHLDAGAGHDTLVLRASSWAEFTDRYQVWLKANFGTMNIESLRWALNGSAENLPEWLHKLITDYNTEHPDAQIDFGPLAADEPAHFAAGSADTASDTHCEASAPHRAGHEHDRDAPGPGRSHDPTGHDNAGHEHSSAGREDNGHGHHASVGHNDAADFVFAGADNGPHIDATVAEILAGYDDDLGHAHNLFAGIIELAPEYGHAASPNTPHEDAPHPDGNDASQAPSTLSEGVVDGGIGLGEPDPVLEFSYGKGNSEAPLSPEMVQHFEAAHLDLADGDTPTLDLLLDSLLEEGGNGREIAPAGVAAHADAQTPVDTGVDPNTGWTQWANPGVAEENTALLLQNALC